MDAVSRTLYIPLYGKALVSRQGIVLHDPWAEEIWAREGFALRGKARSRWLAYYMGMRAAAIDRLVAGALEKDPGAVVLHLGCGLDARADRVGPPPGGWYDLDLPPVMAVRRRHFTEGPRYRMMAGDAGHPAGWLGEIPSGGSAVIVMEGLSMYLPAQALAGLLAALAGHFTAACLILDAYTTPALRASARANPIRTVGAEAVSAIDDPRQLEAPGGFRFCGRHSMTPPALVDGLPAAQRWIFRRVFTGGVAERLYRLYSYRLGEAPGGEA